MNSHSINQNTATDTDDDTPLTGDELLPREHDILAALRVSNQALKENSPTIVVTDPALNREGKPKKDPNEESFRLFTFKVRPLSEREFDKVREGNTKYQRVKRLGGIKMPDGTDSVRYRSEIIYTATLPEKDGHKIWDNPRIREAYPNVIDKVEMVDALIRWAGVKDAIFDRIQDISGYNADTTEESIKN